MRAVCVFPGFRPIYAEAAAQTGRILAETGLAMVYGGSKVGLMGAAADGALAAGGEVFGVLPRALARKELEHEGLTRLEIVETMHQRKARMAELSDAFIALPGGAGTLEEVFEIWTWGQLAIHAKPAAFLNVDGYYDPLRTFLDHAVGEGFLREAHRDMLIFGDNPARLLEQLAAYTAPAQEKWLERFQL
jgi:uncharacterized protein (TIGR00730 family)